MADPGFPDVGGGDDPLFNTVKIELLQSLKMYTIKPKELQAGDRCH